MGFARNLKQTLTYWPSLGSDGFGGFTYGTPTTLNCRWEDKNEMFLNDLGEEEVSKAIVYLDADVNAGDYVAQGDFTTTLDPGTLSGAHRIKAYGKSTDLAGLVALRKLWL